MSGAARYQARKRVDVLDCFILRAEARAILWAAGEYEFHEAVDVLQDAAEDYGLLARIGQDAVQKILGTAFAEYADA